MSRIAAAGVVAFLAACTPPRAIVITPARAPSAPATQPITLTTQLLTDQVIIPTRPATPAQRPASMAPNRINLTATNADVRDLLPTLASAAGVSLIMTSDVRGRISVNLRDVSAIDALRAVIEEAGLTVGTSEIPLPFSPVVFYDLPVNVNTASAATIKARFFPVSDSVANWLVRARTW